MGNMTIDWAKVEPEVTAHLQELVRFDTTNPPGNEKPAAEYLAKVLRREGIEADVLESAPGRGSVLGCLRGSRQAPPFLMISHLDVVAVERDHWQEDPFAGVLKDGYIWGRGSLDTKDLTAQHLMIMLLLKRQGIKLNRDLYFAATADEETTGRFGIGYLIQQRPEILTCACAFNEGAGWDLDVNGQRLYTCETAEKGHTWMRLRARGQPGHGSTPTGDSAVATLCQALARLSTAQFPEHQIRTVDTFTRAVGAAVLGAKAASAEEERQAGETWIRNDPELGRMLSPMHHNTATPTVLRAGEKTNVIPAVAEAEVDGRRLPGQTVESHLAEIMPYLGDKIEVEVFNKTESYETEYDSDLFEIMQTVMAEFDPGSRVVPYMVTGSTDSYYLGPRGIKAYGFQPYRRDSDVPLMQLVHGHNERVSVANLMFGTKTLYEIVRRYCAL